MTGPRLEKTDWSVIPRFTTDDEWTDETRRLRERAMPHAFTASQPNAEARFGAFLGWHWHAVDACRIGYQASQLGAETLARMDLLNIEHQSGGHACRDFSFLGRPVAIHEAYVQVAAGLCRHYWHAWGGGFYFQPRNPEARNAMREEVARYRASLRDVGLSASFALGIDDNMLQVSVYPLDGTNANLARLLADPDRDLRALGPLAANPELRELLCVVILADNSD